jgi:hypothetical protein
VDRIRRRYEDPAMADRFLSQPQLPVVWRFVQELNRPEVRFVDAAQSPDRAHAEARGHIGPRGGSTPACWRHIGHVQAPRPST